MKNITIRILSDSSSSSIADKAPSADVSAIKEKKSPSVAQNKKSGEGVGALAYLAAYNLTSQSIALAKTFAQISYGRYTDLTEDYKSQAIRSNAEAHLNRFGAITGSAISGALLGSKIAGPAGAVVGMAVGISLAAVKNEIARQNTLYEQSKAIHEEAYSLYFNTARAGMINYSRGTEN